MDHARRAWRFVAIACVIGVLVNAGVIVYLVAQNHNRVSANQVLLEQTRKQIIAAELTSCRLARATRQQQRVLAVNQRFILNASIHIIQASPGVKANPYVVGYQRAYNRLRLLPLPNCRDLPALISSAINQEPPTTGGGR